MRICKRKRLKSTTNNFRLLRFSIYIESIEKLVKIENSLQIPKYRQHVMRFQVPVDELIVDAKCKGKKKKKQRQIFEWRKIANKESKIEIECSWRTILNMRSAGAGRINCLHYWNALSFALFEHVNWIGYCRLVGYCCCWYYCRYPCCCFLSLVVLPMAW